MSTVKIYGLLNPLTQQYFYVGITSQKLSKRLSGHMSTTDKNTKKVEVIKSICANNQRPIIVLLETIDNLFESLDRELFWMNKLINTGNPLVNKDFNKRGCKPNGNTKIQIDLYIEESKIELFGGVDRLRRFLYYLTDNYDPTNNLKEYYIEFVKKSSQEEN